MPHMPRPSQLPQPAWGTAHDADDSERPTAKAESTFSTSRVAQDGQATCSLPYTSSSKA